MPNLDPAKATGLLMRRHALRDRAIPFVHGGNAMSRSRRLFMECLMMLSILDTA